MQDEQIQGCEQETSESISENFRKFPVLKNPPAPPTPQITEKQRSAIDLLLRGRSMEATAAIVGVTTRTLYNWRQDETFLAEMEQRRRELYSATAERLRALVEPSLDVIEQHLHDPYDRTRFRAAQTVLRLAKLNEVHDPK